MSLKVYNAILEKANVDKFYGNEDKVREVISRLYAEKLSEDIDVSIGVVHKTISLLRIKPQNHQRVILRKLYDTEVPVLVEKFKRKISHPNIIPLQLLEKLEIIKTDWVGIKTNWVYRTKKIIVEINKDLMETYWPNIKKFEKSYIPRKMRSSKPQRKERGYWIKKAKEILKKTGGITEENINKLSRADFGSELPQTSLPHLKKTLRKKLERGEL